MYRVVLADDEKWSLYGLSQMICWADYQCEICGMAYDGLSALDACRREKPDLLISDIRMPGMDGLELTRCIALEMPRTTVILITGYSDLKYAQQALRLGVFDFLLKQNHTGRPGSDAAPLSGKYAKEGPCAFLQLLLQLF